MAKSRPQRWAEAIAEARTKIDEARTALEPLAAIQEEYQEWLDYLPEVSQGQPVEEKLLEVCDLDLTTEDLQEIEDTLDEAENIDLPRGFGRD